MFFLIIGIKYNHWKNTQWEGDIVPVEIKRSEIPKCEGRHEVRVYNKVLGMLPKNKKKLPFGSSFFASLWSCNNYIKMELVDKPVDWLDNVVDMIYSSIDYYEDGIDAEKAEFINNNVDPIRVHEWLIREGRNYEELEITNLDEYLDFRNWLIEIERLSEDRYGDEALEKYGEHYLREEELLEAEDTVNELVSDWEQEKIEQEYGKGAYKDSWGVVFNDDGECIDII